MGLYNGGGAANAATFVFNGTDRDNYDAVQLFAGTSSCTPSGFECEGGYPGWPMSGTYSAGPAAPDYGWMWFRVQFDGTTLQVWQILGTTTAPTDWTSATLVVSATGCHTTGGKIGFANNFSGIPTNVNYLTIKSWDASTSAFDITEATDTFTIDGSGNGNNTLASDYNGNQTFDGSQFYTYDGWNRLMTVSHGYRDTSGNLQHGQASVNNSYDAKGRRIIKVVNNTGSWDCTYHYFYNGNRQIEQQNGSNETIRQNIWGLGYIDNLIQTSLNSDPADQSNCDTPYWVLQDANFNVLGILNSSGVLVERYEYSAYGQRTVYFSPGSNDPFCMAPTVASQRFMSTGSMTEPYGLCEFGHQGLMQDEECGLVYDRARYLSPALGRFLQRDPMTYVAGLNLYIQESAAPTETLDDTGLLPAEQVDDWGGGDAMSWYLDGMGQTIEINGSSFINAMASTFGATTNASSYATGLLSRIHTKSVSMNCGDTLIYKDTGNAMHLGFDTRGAGIDRWLAFGTVYEDISAKVTISKKCCYGGCMIYFSYVRAYHGYDRYQWSTLDNSVGGIGKWGRVGIVNIGVGVGRWIGRRLRFQDGGPAQGHEYNEFWDWSDSNATTGSFKCAS